MVPQFKIHYPKVQDCYLYNKHSQVCPNEMVMMLFKAVDGLVGRGAEGSLRVQESLTTGARDYTPSPTETDYLWLQGREMGQISLSRET